MRDVIFIQLIQNINIIRMKVFGKYSIECPSIKDLNLLLDRFKKIDDICYSYIDKTYKEDSDYKSIMIYSKKVSEYPDAKILLVAKLSDLSVKITNIIPLPPVWKLSYEEYNNIANSFFCVFVTNILRTELKSINYNLIIENDEVSLEHILVHSFDALYDFASSCNINTPFSHPYDVDRWYKFIRNIYFSNDKEKIDIDLLSRWFVEEKHFHQDVVDDIVIKYEEQIDLLDYIKNNPYNEKSE